MQITDLWHITETTDSFKVPYIKQFSAVYTFCIWAVEERKVSSVPAWKEVMRAKVAPRTAPGCQPAEGHTNHWCCEGISFTFLLTSPFQIKKMGATTCNLISKLQICLFLPGSGQGLDDFLCISAHCYSSVAFYSDWSFYHKYFIWRGANTSYL